MTLKHSYSSETFSDERRHIVPSNYPSHHSLDEQDGLRRSRQPLTDAAGNTQCHQTLANLIESYNEQKSRQSYPVPTLSSQHPRQSTRSSLQNRRHRNRTHRSSRNPIIDSQAYQAYRARQCPDGKDDDQKWPDILELAFLDG